MTLDLDKIEAAAKAATPGPWMRPFGDRTVYDRMEDGCRGVPIVQTPYPATKKDQQNLDFVAAANPEVVQEMVRQLRTIKPPTREEDRVRFPDPDFNKWLDTGISDAGHTVWDQIKDVCDAWAGWEAQKYEAPKDFKRPLMQVGEKDGGQYGLSKAAVGPARAVRRVPV